MTKFFVLKNGVFLIVAESGKPFALTVFSSFMAHIVLAASIHSQGTVFSHEHNQI